jgi:anti-anti-sigma factor
MRVDIAEKAAVTVVAVEGRIDAATAPEFDSACAPLLEGGARDVVLDCGRLEYLSSAGLRSVLALGKVLRERGGGLKLANLAGMAKQILELSGFLSLFPVTTLDD